MKLFYISQSENNDYDTYDSAVVAAENEQLARETHPGLSGEWSKEKEKFIIVRRDSSWFDCSDTWTNDIEAIEVEYLGEAEEGAKAGIICASFHAG